MPIKSFRIATFNAENLLHPGVRFAGRNDRPYTQEEYNDKIRWIIGTLREGRVDLVGFQEQFSDKALKDITQPLELNHVFAPDLDGGKNIVKVSGREEASGPFLALASRFPIVKAESIADFPTETRSLKVQAAEREKPVTLRLTRFQRPVIRADVLLRDDVVATVFVAHLKSKRPQILDGEDDKDPLVQAMGRIRSLIVRAAESIALRKLVIDATQRNTKPAILFGDLNDDVASVTTQTIAGEEPFFLLPKSVKEVEWDRLLYSVHDIEEAESYRDVSYTHIFNGRHEVLDHIFVSEEFAARSSKRIAAVKSTRIFNDHLNDERRSADLEKGPPPRSDHGVPVTEIWWA